MGSQPRCVARPIGTITTRLMTVKIKVSIVEVATADGGTIAIRFVQRKRRPKRFIKVSHHGRPFQRWKPFATHWWSTNVGPIPTGFQIYHRDGDPLNESPDNLVIAREQRFQVQAAADRRIVRRRKARQARAVARSNAQRGEVSRAYLRQRAWYVVIESEALIWWCPYRTRKQAENGFPVAVMEYPSLISRKWRIIRGDHLALAVQAGGMFVSFRRLIPNLPANMFSDNMPFVADIEPKSSERGHYEIDGGNSCSD